METEYIWFTLGIVALTLLLTGPGLWSEKWGWSLLKRFNRKRKPTR